MVGLVDFRASGPSRHNLDPVGQNQVLCMSAFSFSRR
jgi:hypothetical protein